MMIILMQIIHAASINYRHLRFSRPWAPNGGILCLPLAHTTAPVYDPVMGRPVRKPETGPAFWARSHVYRLQGLQSKGQNKELNPEHHLVRNTGVILYGSTKAIRMSMAK